MKQPQKMKIAELQYPKSIWWWAKPSNKLIFHKEAYLIVRIKSLEKNAMKSSIFFSKLYVNQTYVKLIDDKFLYGTVDWRR